MNLTRPFKHTALTLALAYLFLSGFIMVGAGGHVAEHDHSAHHTKQHSTFICTWMCAASSFVHSTDPKISHNIIPSFESPIVTNEQISRSLSIFSFYIRPPPFSLL